MSGPQRNDPCPCGSGKKFKRCCASATAEPSEASAGYTPSERKSALTMLMRFSERREFEREFTLARTLFWEPRVEELTNDELDELLVTEMVALNFHNFFTLDFDIDNGRTLVDIFLERRGASLPPGARRFLQDLRRSHVGLYEVTSVPPGEGPRLQSLWGEKRIVCLEEQMASDTFRRGDVLATRVVQRPDGTNIMEGDVYPFSAQFKARILEQLELDRLAAEAEGRTLGPEAFLKSIAFRFHGLWLEEYLQTELPDVMTVGGEAVEGTMHKFAIEDPSQLVRALDACEELQAEEHDKWGLTREVDGTCHIVAELDIADDTLTVLSLSRAHGEAARDLVERIAGKAVRHLETEYRSPRQLVQAAQQVARTAADRETRGEPLPPEAPGSSK